MPMSPSSTSSTAPSEALIQLIAPDGYYHYLGVPKTSTDASGGSSSDPSLSRMDLELIKKNYRKLSLKHHPDRPGGDVETFRMLNRAYRVLSHTKMRQQYDILGLDLDEDAEDDRPSSHAASANASSGEDAASTNNINGTTTSSSSSSTPSSPTDEDTDSSSPEDKGILNEMATVTLTAMMQMVVRSAMMGLVAVWIVLYHWTLYPALAFMAFIAVTMIRRLRPWSHGIKWSGSSLQYYSDLLSPLLISTGLLLMHVGRRAPEYGWSLKFWFGEALVMGMFVHNSLPPTWDKSRTVLLVLAVLSLILSLLLRGRGWHYATALGLEIFLMALLAVAFPLVEILLETLVQDKLRKVGDKIRTHHQFLQKYYEHQLLLQQQQHQHQPTKAPNNNRDETVNKYDKEKRKK